ncbi:unnamed protein product [Peronospora farinosa]|uniref:Uncharacterized protein n=1 Tax=Peronospora farinosa TaxID=134698 RepID=A0ABN8C724_9STRA|nr:unnamed protein product [Peronospora farinosa]
METGHHHMLLHTHSKKRLQTLHTPTETQMQFESSQDVVMISNETEVKLHTFERLHAEGFAYLADNSYIRSGYRLHYSTRDCFLSLFELHNETLNVWTHIVGSFIFLMLMLYLALSGHALSPITDTTSLATPQSWCHNDQQWMVDGHHTPRMLLAAGLPELCLSPTGCASPPQVLRSGQRHL